MLASRIAVKPAVEGAGHLGLLIAIRPEVSCSRCRGAAFRLPRSRAALAPRSRSSCPASSGSQPRDSRWSRVARWRARLTTTSSMSSDPDSVIDRAAAVRISRPETRAPVSRELPPLSRRRSPSSSRRRAPPVATNARRALVAGYGALNAGALSRIIVAVPIARRRHAKRCTSPARCLLDDRIHSAQSESCHRIFRRRDETTRSKSCP